MISTNDPDKPSAASSGRFQATRALLGSLLEHPVLRGRWLSIALEAGNMGVFLHDPKENRTLVDQNLAALTGLVHGDPWIAADEFYQRIDPDDREAVVSAIGKAVSEGAAYEAEFRFHPVGGDPIWLAGRGEMVEESTLGHTVLAGVNFDVTAMKEAELRARDLSQEMLHRVKNAFAVVQGIARMSARSASDLESFAATFDARLDALAKLNVLTVETGRGDVPLRALCESILEPYRGAGQVRLEVPEITVNDAAGQTLALALNELATNALKHGALGEAGGKVTCRVEIDEGSDRFTFAWSERRETPIAPVPDRKGFGDQVLSWMTRTTFKGEPVFVWHTNGLDYSCRWKLSDMH